MFDRPKYNTYHVWSAKTATVRHDDVHLDEGESVGIVIGNRRIVVSVDDFGQVSTKVQKRVTIWKDI
jgi:hypothetical protein